MSVDKNFRGQGVGTALAKAMQSTIDPGFSLQVINIDKSLVDAIEFFKKVGFYERLCQHEMTLSL
jgi:ribosomal protein S18 acetylase RimI-like enzyme